jgi:hypothetical protein
MDFLACIAERLAVPPLDELARYRPVVRTSRSPNAPFFQGAAGERLGYPEMCRPSQKRVDLKNPEDFENS